MEDIFSNDNNGSGISYIMHKNADKTWYSNEEAVTLDKIMVCPDTIKTGSFDSFPPSIKVLSTNFVNFLNSSFTNWLSLYRRYQS